MTGFPNKVDKVIWWVLILFFALLFSVMMFDWYLSKDDETISSVAEAVFQEVATKIEAENIITDVKCRYADNWWIDLDNIKNEDIRRIDTVTILQKTSDAEVEQEIRQLLLTLSTDYGMNFERISFFVIVDRAYSLDFTTEEIFDSTTKTLYIEYLH